MQSSWRIASSNCMRSRIQHSRKFAGHQRTTTVRLNETPRASVVSLTTNHVALLHTGNSGPLCESGSVNAQLKEVSNVDTPERIRKAWHHPEFPVDKMTELLVSILEMAQLYGTYQPSL